ncbi:MAG: hypothetical protein EZS28_051140, partial [Streblomastix strix]
QVFATPSSPTAESFAGKTVETYKGCQWSPLAYSLLVPALPFTTEFDGIASLAGVTQSGTISPLLYQSVSYIHTVPLSALNAKSPLAELGKFSGELFGFVAVLMDYFRLIMAVSFGALFHATFQRLFTSRSTAPARLAPAPSAPPIPGCIIPTGPDIVDSTL